MKKVLVVHYAPGEYSHTDASVAIVKEIIGDKAEVIELDLLKTPAKVFDRESLNSYVKRNFKNEDLDEPGHSSLSDMDSMAEQLLSADILVLAYPMYNFHLPAAVKAWIDAVVQKKKLFRHTENGPEGLAKAEFALNLMSTGAVRINSSKDFATPYINYIMNYIGIKNVHTTGITGTNLVIDKTEKFEQLRDELKTVIDQYLN
jgi:FMN-dependent NADH-azoreductase